jgi:hypothetical protein
MRISATCSPRSSRPAPASSSLVRTRVSHEVDGVVIPFIGRASLVKNKRATGRAKDLADLEALGEDPRG